MKGQLPYCTSTTDVRTFCLRVPVNDLSPSGSTWAVKAIEKLCTYVKSYITQLAER